MAIEILSEKPINIATLKTEISKIEKRDKEPNLRVKGVEDFLNHFSILAFKDQQKLHKNILALKVPRLKETHINKLIDIMPTTLEDVKTVLQGYPLTVTNENLKKIADTIAEFVKK